MPRRYTSASDDLNEPRVYVNNMNVRHPATGLSTSRPPKRSGGFGGGGGGAGAAATFPSSGSSLSPTRTRGIDVGSSSAVLPAVPGAPARPRARVLVPAADDVSSSANGAAVTTAGVAQELHPNLEQVYSRVMRRLQRQVNYEELNRVSLADQFGIDAEEGKEGNAAAAETAPMYAQSQTSTSRAGAAASHGGGSGVSTTTAAAAGSPSSMVGPTGVFPASSFVRFTTEKSNAADEAEADEAELSLSSQPCPRTLRLVVQHVQSILAKKLEVAEQGSLKDCLRFTFESRALLDRLLKEIPSYTQYRDETAFLELDRASKSAAASLMSTSRLTGATGHAASGVSRQKLHGLFEEFRKEPVLMPHAQYTQDPVSGAVEATLDTAQEHAIRRVVSNGAVESTGGASMGASTATMNGGIVAASASGEAEPSGDDTNPATLPDIHTRRVPALSAALSSSAAASSTAAGSPRGAAAPGSVRVVYAANDTGISAQYTKLAKHLIGAASPNTKARQAVSGGGGGVDANTSGRAAGGGRMSLPETYCQSVRLLDKQRRDQPGEEEALLLSEGSHTDKGDHLEQLSHTQPRTSSVYEEDTASFISHASTGTGKREPYMLVDAETGAVEVGRADMPHGSASVVGTRRSTARPMDTADDGGEQSGVSVGASSSRRARALAQQHRAFVNYSSPTRRATQRVDVGTLTDESGLTTVALDEHEALQAHVRALEVKLAEGRQHQEELRSQLLEESSYADQKRHIVQYLRRTLLRECNTLRSQLSFASQRERQLQTALKEASTAMAAAAANGNGGPAHGHPGSSMTLAASMSLGARRSVFSSARQESLTPPTAALNAPLVPPLSSGSSSAAAAAAAAAHANNNNQYATNLDNDVTGIQSLLDLVLLGVENDETLAVPPDVIKRMTPEAAQHALKPNPRHAQEQLRAELDERQRQLKETILSLKIKHSYELAMKDREIERLQHLTDIEYIHKQLSENVKAVRADFRQVKYALLEELQSFRVMMEATVKSLANRARMMDLVVQENVVLQNTLDASTDLIDSATALFVPMLSSEYTHGYHPWPVKLRNTIDPLAHLVQVRYGPAEVIRLRPSLDTLSELYLTLHWFVMRSVALPDATRPTYGRALKELCSALLRSATTSTDVLFEVRRLYEREHQLMRQMARVNAKLMWNTYLQNAYAERSMAALAEGDLDPRTTTLPVHRLINVLAAQRRELAKTKTQLDRERSENAKEVYRIWRDRQVDINEGHAPPLVTNRLTLLSEAQVLAAQKRGGNTSVAVRTNPGARPSAAAGTS